MTITDRIVNFISETDPFGDRFSQHDLDQIGNQAMTFEQKCRDLAEEALEDEAGLSNDRRICALAQIIQHVIEAYIVTERDNYEPPDPPGFEGGFADNH